YGVSMNKLYDYMMSGKPIIHAVDASNSDVDDAKCGISIEPCNSSELERALKQLFSMTPEEAKIMGEKGKKAVIEKYNYKALADRFLEILIR
ncbi:MAG: glycosyltransferase WbuB, partial [Clostridia bacterium]|nr:glycosyltransferase WbuB [Clostridia bacterium]